MKNKQPSLLKMIYLIISLIVVLIFEFGFLLPFLISYNDDLVVMLGFVLFVMSIIATPLLVVA